MITLRPCQEEAVARVYEHLRTRDDNPCKVKTCLDRSSWSFSRSALSLSFASSRSALSLSFASLSASFAVIPSISVPVYNIDVH